MLFRSVVEPVEPVEVPVPVVVVREDAREEITVVQVAPQPINVPVAVAVAEPEVVRVTRMAEPVEAVEDGPARTMVAVLEEMQAVGVTAHRAVVVIRA